MAASDGRPEVSVLVPVLNEAAHLPQTVPAMLAQDIPHEFELLFMEGGSGDGSRAVLERFAREDRRIRILHNPGPGTPRGLNAGLRAARGEYVARMDAHTSYPPGYLRTGVERLRRGDVEHVSGPQVPQGAGSWSRRIALALGFWLGVGGARYRRATTEIETDTGFTGMWRRATLLRHGGWDEHAYPNEDAELAARIRAAGGRLVCVPGMAATYVPRDGLPALARQYWRYGQYRARTSALHPESMRRSHVLPPGLALSLAAALGPGPLNRPARSALWVYGACLVATSALAARRAPRTDAALLPAVFATMHLAWGLGFLAGSARFGPPLRALARLAAPPVRSGS